MDNCKELLIENIELLKSISQTLIEHVRNERTMKNPPLRIAKGKKEAFLLVVWAMYMNGMFVMADCPEDEEKQAQSLKSVMDWFGVPFDVTYNNPHQILSDILSRKDCIQVCYDLLNTVSTQYVKKRKKQNS
jgi:hypothetical protein